MMNRRSLLLGLSAVLAAPAIVKAESLMKLWVPRPTLVTLDDYAEGVWEHGGYVRVDDLVHVYGRITLTTMGSGDGTALITGIPWIANQSVRRLDDCIDFSGVITAQTFKELRA